MGIQDELNNGMYQTLQILALSDISKAIKGLGVSTPQELESKIHEVEIQIAVRKDQGKDYTNLQELLEKYEKAKADYEEALIRAEKEQRRKQNIFWGIFAGITIVVSIVLIVVLVNVCNS